MNNIFENAYFGKAYKTRDGRKALYLKKGESGKHALIYENEQTYYVNPDGCYYNLECFINPQDYMISTDIISEWEEEIDEEKLYNIAEQYAEEAPMTGLTFDGYDTPIWIEDDIITAFEAGYRAAKKGE